MKLLRNQVQARASQLFEFLPLKMELFIALSLLRIAFAQKDPQSEHCPDFKIGLWPSNNFGITYNGEQNTYYTFYEDKYWTVNGTEYARGQINPKFGGTLSLYKQLPLSYSAVTWEDGNNFRFWPIYSQDSGAKRDYWLVDIRTNKVIDKVREKRFEYRKGGYQYYMKRMFVSSLLHKRDVLFLEIEVCRLNQCEQKFWFEIRQGALRKAP